MSTRLAAATSRARVAAAAVILAAAAALPAASSASAGDPFLAGTRCVRAAELPVPSSLPARGKPSEAAPASDCRAGWALRPVRRVAPKGRPLAPSPPGGGEGLSAANGYWYASADQSPGPSGSVMSGIHGSLSQPQPYLGVNDFHTLAEIAAASGDLNQAVEVGWTVDRGVNGDSLPHIFVFHWVNHVPTCYDACGFVPASSPWAPGMPVPVTLTPQDFAIVHVSGTGWWIMAEGSWIGYFPDSLWPASVNFTTVGIAEWFGEVSAQPGATPCSFMGDGIYGGLPGAALADNLGFFDPAFNDIPASPTTIASTGGPYSASAPFFNSFTFGGPGGGCP